MVEQYKGMPANIKDVDPQRLMLSRIEEQMRKGYGDNLNIDLKETFKPVSYTQLREPLSRTLEEFGYKYNPKDLKYELKGKFNPKEYDLSGVESTGSAFIDMLLRLPFGTAPGPTSGDNKSRPSTPLSRPPLPPDSNAYSPMPSASGGPPLLPIRYPGWPVE